MGGKNTTAKKEVRGSGYLPKAKRATKRPVNDKSLYDEDGVVEGIHGHLPSIKNTI